MQFLSRWFKPAPSLPDVFPIAPTMSFGREIELTGEKFYMGGIRALLGDEQRRDTVAVLLPDPKNKHDASSASIAELAVQVGVSASTVQRALVRHGIARLPRNRNRRPPSAQVLDDDVDVSACESTVGEVDGANAVCCGATSGSAPIRGVPISMLLGAVEPVAQMRLPSTLLTGGHGTH